MIIDNHEKSNKNQKIPSNNNRTSIYDLFGIKKESYEKLKNEEKKISPIQNKVINSNNVEEEIEEENYIKINTKNQFEIYNSIESNKKLDEILKYVDEFIEEDPSKESLNQIFLEKLFPKCLNKAFLISKVISKRMMRLKKINKDLIENKIKYFFDLRIVYRYSKKLVLNKDNINNLGYILCYSYSKFDDFKIIEKNDLNNYIKLSRKIDTINEYYDYCNKTGKNPMLSGLLDFLESKNNIYLIPGEFLFLINIFECITILEIDMNIDLKKFNGKYDDDFYLFIITYLNIHYLAILTNHFKINFNNERIQKDIYSYFTDELQSIYNCCGRYLKKNKELSEKEYYKNRWDFEKDYLVKNISKRFNIKENESIINSNIKQESMTNDSIYNNDNDEINKNLKGINYNSFVDVVKVGGRYKSSVNINRINSYSTQSFNLTSISQVKTQIGEEEEIDGVTLTDNNINRSNSYVQKNGENNINNKYGEMIEKNRNILELIYIVCLGILRLKNLKNLDLIMNDCYYKEFINLFRQNYYTSKSSNSLNNFHLLNNFIKKMKNLQKFNIEFNCLDYLSFYKLLSILKRNENVNSLQISFFSSLIIYSPQYIYKLYLRNKEKPELNNNDIYNLESYLINELLPFFIENLEVLFELIKSRMKNYEILSFNFDVPDIIALQQRYLIVIIKFILNILFLVDNRQSKIKKLVILSPKTIIDSRSILNIQDFIDTIDIDKKNKTIKELSIQMQFYKISNIKNLISHNLTILKIGEMDTDTLKGLAKHLCSFQFFRLSSLTSLTIGLLNSIIYFTKEIEYLLNEIFSIKIKTLVEINIYSNLFIKRQNYLYKILSNNWISSYIITLNEKSKLSWKQNEIDEKINQIMDDKKDKIININTKKNQEKKILYLIHNELEHQILTPNEKAQRNKKKLINTDCEVAWYLKYLLIFKYSKNNKYTLNYYDVKNIIFNILKFLYFTKTTKIKTDINEI